MGKNNKKNRAVKKAKKARKFNNNYAGMSFEEFESLSRDLERMNLLTKTENGYTVNCTDLKKADKVIEEYCYNEACSELYAKGITPEEIKEMAKNAHEKSYRS